MRIGNYRSIANLPVIQFSLVYELSESVDAFRDGGSTDPTRLEANK
jgi:hypothetical protein